MVADCAKANFDPTFGLRGVCAILIVFGHFFDLFAPRRFRYLGFDGSVAGCESFDAAKEKVECYPSRAPLAEAYPIIDTMYMTPVALFFAISGVLFAYLYYDSFHILDSNAHPGQPGSPDLIYTHKVTWFAFLSKRYHRVAPQLWFSLLWLAPNFFMDLGMTNPTSSKLMALLIAPTPLFVLQPLLLLGLEWNSIMWQVSCLFVCYACVPRLFKWLKSVEIARARCPTDSPNFQPLTADAFTSAPGGLVSRVVGLNMSKFLTSAWRVTGVGFWVCYVYSLAAYWTIYYTLCDAECVHLGVGEMLSHMTFYTRFPQFVLGF